MSEDDEELLRRIDEALEGVEREGGDAFEPMRSVKRQLLWCRARLSGEHAGARPGPFTMGLTAVRELDMYGENPELADDIVRIEREMEARLNAPRGDA